MAPRILKADFEDLEEILELQHLSFESEGNLLGNSNIPPLTQTIEDLRSEYINGVSIFKMCLENAIIGSVRVRENSETGTVYIGKLMVHPMYRRQGYGTKLLKEVEKLIPGRRYELFTSIKSTDNIRLYEKNGYRIVAQRVVGNDLVLVDMEKDLAHRGFS
jgi:ribosomal protein S18 acetylase RimI-like enzyme